MECDLHRRWYHHLVLPRLRCLSTGVGGGCVLKLRFRRSDPGRGPGLAVWRQPEEARVWQLRVCSEEAWANQRGKVPLLGGAQGEGWDRYRSFFPCTHGLRQQDTTYTSSGGRCELPLPLWAPETGTGHHHCHYGLQRWAQVAATTKRPASRIQLLPLLSWECEGRRCKTCEWAPSVAPTVPGGRGPPLLLENL